MSVYVDESRWLFRGQRYCHMAADTLDELHAMADRLGLRRQWFQDKPGHPHYDLSPAMRQRAVALGAIEVTARQLVARRYVTQEATDA